MSGINKMVFFLGLFISSIFAQTKNIQIIDPSSMLMISPGDQVTVRWVAKNVSLMKLEYCANYNSGLTTINNWVTITEGIQASTSSYAWLTPAALSSSASGASSASVSSSSTYYGPTLAWSARLRLSDISNPSVYDLSEYDVTAYNQIRGIRLESPNGGEQWYAGDSLHNITWAFSGFFTVEIDYSTDKIVWTTIPTGTIFASQISYRWSIPSDLSCSPCYIRVRSASGSVSDISELPFNITRTTPVSSAFGSSASSPVQNHKTLVPAPAVSGMVRYYSPNGRVLDGYEKNGIAVHTK